MRHAAHPVSAEPQRADGDSPVRADRFLALLASIAAEPWRWNYFQALRLLDCLNPGLPRLGQARRPADEAVRLGQQPALDFAPASLAGLAPAHGKIPARISVRFFGLFGPNGPLPLHLSEYARNRLLHAGDASLVRFADLIHHRFLSLFYRAWAQAQPCVSLDRPGQDRFAHYVGALCGLGLDSLRGRDALPDHAKLHHAAGLSRQVRHAEGLARILSGCLGLPVAVESFVGHWMELREGDRMRLGCNGQLGRDALLGRRVWDRQHKFRLQVGPLSLPDYGSLLPQSGGLALLAAAVRNYVGFEFDWDLCLLLRADSVPRLALGGKQRLGYSSWLGRRRSGLAAGDLVLSVPWPIRPSGPVANAGAGNGDPAGANHGR